MYTALRVSILFTCFYLTPECFCAPSLIKQLSEDKMSNIKTYAEQLKNYINPEIDPCLDYHAHICAHSWPRIFPDGAMESLIDQFLKSNKLIDAEKKVQAFLESCVNFRGKQNIEMFLRDFNFPDTINGWPALNSNWEAKNFDLLSILVELKSFDIMTIFNHNFAQNGERRTLKILTSYYYVPIRAEDRKIEEKWRKNSLQKLSISYVEELVQNSFHYEEEYMKAMSNITDNGFQTVTYKEFKEKVSGFEWDKYFEKIGNEVPRDEDLVETDSTEKLVALISAIKTMNPKTFVNYIMYKILLRIYEDIESSACCYKKIFEYFRLILSRFIVHNIFEEDYKKQFLNIVSLIANTSEKFGSISNNSKVAEDITIFLEEKYMPTLTENAVNDYFADIVMDSENYYKNYFQLIRLEQRNMKERNINNRGISKDDTSWSINRIIPFIFSPSTYGTFMQCSAILFYELNLLAQEILVNENLDPIYNQSISKCFDLKAEESYAVPFIQKAQILINNFHEWTKLNKDIIMEENSVLKEFELSNNKILYAIIMESTCGAPHDLTAKMLTFTFQNFEDFQKEYNCTSNLQDQKSSCSAFLT